jgi:hypothetical protein
VELFGCPNSFNDFWIHAVVSFPCQPHCAARQFQTRNGRHATDLTVAQQPPQLEIARGFILASSSIIKGVSGMRSGLGVFAFKL